MSVEIIGLRDIAKRMKRSPVTIQRWIRKKNLPAFRVDGEGPYILMEEELQEWYRAQKGRKDQAA